MTIKNLVNNTGWQSEGRLKNTGDEDVEEEMEKGAGRFLIVDHCIDSPERC